MDELIQKIIDIENKAQSVVREARSDREHIDETIEKTIADMKEDFNKRASDKCESIKSIEDADADKKITAIEAAKKASVERLEEIYRNKCDEWVDDIVDEIINS